MDRLKMACQNESGMLMLINLDNFFLFNDVYGRDMGDKLIARCVSIIDSVTNGDDIKGRLGGDEFIIFCKGLKSKDEIQDMLGYINKKIERSIEDILGIKDKISMGVSIGAVPVPEQGTDYETLFSKADYALDHIKQTGNHGCAFYTDETNKRYKSEMGDLSKNMDEKGDERGALWLDYEYFSIVYRYIRRHIETYNDSALKMLVTIVPKNVNMNEYDFYQVVKKVGMLINSSLRRSDIMMQSRQNQFFLLLPEFPPTYIEKMVARITKKCEDTGVTELVDVNIQNEMIMSSKENAPKGGQA
ncbi:MAG: GGDEF domain-containing protein [Eubacterium sp.]|nr:GGDEF domain-containing protein [Eubacterium sp.]